MLAVGAQQGGEDLDAGGLPRAVGSENAEYLSAFGGEADAAQGMHLTEGFADVFDIYGRIASAARCC